jgi:tetratricopeptide (TPR) repeat protein
MRGQNYEGAIETWSQVIRQDPGDHQAYYGRAYSYLRMIRGIGIRELYVQHTQAALADAERAIALSPEPNGDYYLARSWAFENLALAAYLRVDRDRLNEVALENLRVGISLPHNEPLVIYTPVALLLRLGRCDEALQEADRLEQERGTGLAPSPLLTYYQGVGLLCKGEYQEALDAFIVARNAYGECEYDYQQAVALYFWSRSMKPSEVWPHPHRLPDLRRLPLLPAGPDLV